MGGGRVSEGAYALCGTPDVPDLDGDAGRADFFLALEYSAQAKHAWCETCRLVHSTRTHGVRSHRTPIVGVYVVGAVKLSALPDKKLDSVLLPEPLGPTIVSLSPGASDMVRVSGRRFQRTL